MKISNIITLLLLVCLLSAPSRAEQLLHVPTAADADESAEVFAFLSSMKILPKPTYREPLPKKTIITYYKVTDTGLQKKIVNKLKAEKKKHSWKPVEVHFMKEEVLLVTGDITKRGKEIELAREIIE